MSWSEKIELENSIKSMRRILSQPALPVGDLQPVLKSIVDAVEQLNWRVSRLEDESEAGRRATVGLR